MKIRPEVMFRNVWMALNKSKCCCPDVSLCDVQNVLATVLASGIAHKSLNTVEKKILGFLSLSSMTEADLEEVFVDAMPDQYGLEYEQLKVREARVISKVRKGLEKLSRLGLVTRKRGEWYRKL